MLDSRAAPVSLLRLAVLNVNLFERVVLDPDGGSWTILSPDPVRGVDINENRGILAEEKKVRRLKRPPQR